jgi:hypothetical protein
MPVREKATTGPGSRASRPFSRPRAYATRRETAGLSAYSRGIHCRERLTAGGKWIRTPSSTSQATYGGGRISAKNKAGLPSQAGPKERKRASRKAAYGRGRVGTASLNAIRFTARAASVPPISASVSNAAVCSGTGCSAPKPRNRRQSASKATTAPTSRRLPASVARMRWDASEAVATTGKEIELRAGHQIGPISASGIAVSCLGAPRTRKPRAVPCSAVLDPVGYDPDRRRLK